jgi:putative SOS response-associated peptidase YedK
VRDEGVVYRPRYNLAPGDQHWIVRREKGARVLMPAQWGFPTNTSRLLINARAETAASRPAFRDAYRGRRCLVPADGFYEWRKDGKKSQPFWFHHPDGHLLLMAGVFTAAEKPAFTILTMAANDVVSPAHDRMPVVLSEEGARAWLEDPKLDLLGRRDLGLDLVATPVSTIVNSAAYDGPECLEPPREDPEPPPPHKQLRLID